MKKDEKYYMEYNLKSLTKKSLLNDPSLGFGLARYNKKFVEHPLGQDLEVLSLCDGKVAMELAANSNVNGWALTEAAQRLEVLGLRDGIIAAWLARNSGSNRWITSELVKILKLCDGSVEVKALVSESNYNGWGKTPAAQNIDVLKMYREEVALWLAKCSDVNGWGNTKVTEDPEVLGLCFGMVAFWLAVNSDENKWLDSNGAEPSVFRKSDYAYEILALVNLVRHRKGYHGVFSF